MSGVQRWVASCAAVILIAAMHAAPAGAAVVFVYSEPGGQFGWCQASAMKNARACAAEFCTKAGGTDCRRVLACRPDGWGAAAVAAKPAAGVGFSCGMRDLAIARKAALAMCISASGTFCAVDASFSASRQYGDGGAFARVWYGQLMLNAAGQDAGTPDGRMGPKTQSAIRGFQTALGRAATGEMDDEVFDRLVDAVGGVALFRKLVQAQVLAPNKPLLPDHTFAHAVSPALLSPDQELLARPPYEQRLALATMVAVSGSACTLPAAGVSHTPLTGWTVTCAEGVHAVLFTEDGYTVARKPGLLGPDVAGPRAVSPARLGLRAGETLAVVPLELDEP